MLRLHSQHAELEIFQEDRGQQHNDLVSGVHKPLKKQEKHTKKITEPKIPCIAMIKILFWKRCSYKLWSEI